ncbi:hypothetical protein BT69DRAFT_1282943 [Atractiella rhizophila]|nr:hypothetical protein BT69DRAFT_1282943 [Atractiella rhizophila]
MSQSNLFVLFATYPAARFDEDEARSFHQLIAQRETAARFLDSLIVPALAFSCSRFVLLLLHKCPLLVSLTRREQEKAGL